jgi:hypothetical protein
MPESLATQCRAAVWALVRTLAAEVPTGQVYNRPTAEFAPARDLAPGTGGAVIVCETPGGSVTTRELLRYRDLTFPVSVILACPQNRIQKVGDPERPAGPDWRMQWREAVVALTAVPLAGVAGCRRLALDNATSLDGTQYESANLWWTAVNLRCLCRVSKKGS